MSVALAPPAGAGLFCFSDYHECPTDLNTWMIVGDDTALSTPYPLEYALLYLPKSRKADLVDPDGTLPTDWIASETAWEFAT